MMGRVLSLDGTVELTGTDSAIVQLTFFNVLKVGNDEKVDPQNRFLRRHRKLVM